MWSEKETLTATVQDLPKHAAWVRKRSSRKPGVGSEEQPRNPGVLWLPLGAVIYAWSDGRDASTDKSWWQNAGLRFNTPLIPLPAPSSPPQTCSTEIEEAVVC